MIDVRKDFPLTQKVVYFDNACTTLKPQQVIDAVVGYYKDFPGCAVRSQHRLAKRAHKEFEAARVRIARFVDAKPEEVIFTKNTTEALNLAFSSIARKGKAVTSVMEHHSVLLPLRKNFSQIEYVKPDLKGDFAEQAWLEAVGGASVVATHLVNNTISTSPPLHAIVKAARESNALVVVDAAQGVPHKKVSFRKGGFDLMAFSGHKMLGPTGIGCLIAREEVQKEMKEFMVGGGTVETVSLEGQAFFSNVHRFEAGIQDYAGGIGLAAACDYLDKVGLEKVALHEKAVADALDKRLTELGVEVIGSKNRGGLVLFNVPGVEPHEVELLLDELAAVAVRAGAFCAMPALAHLGYPKGAVRASCYLYNSLQEVDRFADAVKQIKALSGR